MRSVFTAIILCITVSFASAQAFEDQNQGSATDAHFEEVQALGAQFFKAIMSGKAKKVSRYFLSQNDIVFIREQFGKAGMYSGELSAEDMYKESQAKLKQCMEAFDAVRSKDWKQPKFVEVGYVNMPVFAEIQNIRAGVKFEIEINDKIITRHINLFDCLLIDGKWKIADGFELVK